MLGPMKEFLAGQLDEIREGGLFKGERVIAGPQRAVVELQDGEPLLNMCANNYLGLASHPDIIGCINHDYLPSFKPVAKNRYLDEDNFRVRDVGHGIQKCTFCLRVGDRLECSKAGWILKHQAAEFHSVDNACSGNFRPQFEHLRRRLGAGSKDVSGDVISGENHRAKRREDSGC